MTSITRTAAVLVVVAGLALAGCSAPHKNSSTTGPAAPQRATGGGAAGGGAGGAAAPAAPGTPLLYDGTAPPSDDRQAFGTEIDPATTPESTFAMDVDTASYGYARNLLRQGQRPDPQNIRPEEFVNAFREDYRQPAGKE